MSGISDRVNIHATTVLSLRKYLLRSIDFSWRRSDGDWQRATREAYDKGDGAAVLLFNRMAKTVVLVRQFRLPAFLNGYQNLLLEAPAGMLEGLDPLSRIVAEIEEETGYHVTNVEKIFDAFMSPGAFTERLHFFIAEYDSHPKPGGGIKEEGEDIEVLEMPFLRAYDLIASGGIVDAKTIALLQYAKLNLFA